MSHLGHHRDETENIPSRILTSLFCFVAAMLGLVLAFPMSILIPESLNLGLTVGESVFIVSARPASSLIVLLIQPSMNKLSNYLYLICTSVVCCLGFASFYFSVNTPTAYLYLAVFARAVSGTTLFLINNKTVVGMTTHLKGNVTTSTALWETFFFLGIAAGVAVGSLVDVAIGFPLTMVTAGLILLGSVLLLACIFPNSPNQLSEVSSEPTPKEMVDLALDWEMVVYCWIPMFCIGAGANFTEGVTTEFYRSEYNKSMEFGGFLQLGTLVSYTVTSAVLGVLRDKWPIVKIIGLAAGFLGAGLVVPCIGPIGPLQLLLPDTLEIIISGIAVNMLQMCICAVLLNSVTLSALVLCKKLPKDSATSLGVNMANAAYAAGSVVGPAVGGQLLMKFRFKTVWAVGTPFYFLTSIVVGTFAYFQSKRNALPLTDENSSQPLSQ